MLIQNIGKKSFILSINGEPTKIDAETIIDVDEELAKDLLENYVREWKKLELPTATIVEKTEEKVVETKTTTRKKK